MESSHMPVLKGSRGRSRGHPSLHWAYALVQLWNCSGEHHHCLSMLFPCHQILPHWLWPEIVLTSWYAQKAQCTCISQTKWGCDFIPAIHPPGSFHSGWHTFFFGGSRRCGIEDEKDPEPCIPAS